jgi:hypothetical protein
MVRVPEGRFAIEQTPAVSRGGDHGVVAVGAVGSRRAGRLRIFRYEIRRWRDGEIPDIAAAVDSPRRLTEVEDVARRVLAAAAEVPTPVWGRDQLRAGEMWNSNSVVAWILTHAGIDADRIEPPPRGRAPGWRAGVVVAGRTGGGPGRR